MDSTGTFWLPPSSSTMSGNVDSLFYFIFWISVALFALVTLTSLYFAIRYRHRGKRELTSGVAHNTTLEITWTIIPTILVFIIFAWGFRDYLRLQIIPRDAMEVKVTGQKWFWQFDYPEGATEVNKLVVPVDKPVKLLMSSKDVIHSFYVPNFRIKMDVLPNRYTTIWFEATQTGEFNLFCAEYCGKGHSEMVGKVIVTTEAEYLKWLDKVADPGKGLTLQEYGEKLYRTKACVTCHSVDGSANQGPTWKGLFGGSENLNDGSSVNVDENYVRESILSPTAKIAAGYQAIMPTYQGILKDREIDAIIAYMKTLK